MVLKVIVVRYVIGRCTIHNRNKSTVLQWKKFSRVRVYSCVDIFLNHGKVGVFV
jgi:hypothetical protein